MSPIELWSLISVHIECIREGSHNHRDKELLQASLQLFLHLADSSLATAIDYNLELYFPLGPSPPSTPFSEAVTESEAAAMDSADSVQEGSDLPQSPGTVSPSSTVSSPAISVPEGLSEDGLARFLDEQMEVKRRRIQNEVCLVLGT